MPDENDYQRHIKFKKAENEIDVYFYNDRMKLCRNGNESNLPTQDIEKSTIWAIGKMQQEGFEIIEDFKKERTKDILKDRDSDGDGISDYDEMYVHKTNPYDIDTDGDGINDKIEISLGKNPNENNSNTKGISERITIAKQKAAEQLTNQMPKHRTVEIGQER